MLPYTLGMRKLQYVQAGGEPEQFEKARAEFYGERKETFGTMRDIRVSAKYTKDGWRTRTSVEFDRHSTQADAAHVAKALEKLTKKVEGAREGAITLLGATASVP